MRNTVQAVYWEAPEHRHIEKGTDWYWIVGIVALSAAAASIIFGNALFGIVIVVATIALVLVSFRSPKIIPYEISTRGIRIDDVMYPYNTLESYTVDHSQEEDPQLIVKSKKVLMPLLIMAIPTEYIEEIENIVAARLVEEALEEPLAHKIMEYLGF